MADPKKISYLLQDVQTQLSRRGDAWEVKQHRFLGLPSIISGEAFSSWVWRVVATGLITKKQLLRKLKIKRQAHWVDGSPDLLDIDVFQKKFNGFSIDVINSTLLFFDTSLSKSKICCLTTDLLNKRPIYRYCPCCFKEDPIPYIRKNWRLAFSYICQIHHCFLEERCPACNNILNLEDPVLCDPEITGHISMQFCQVCGHDLTELEQRPEYSGIVNALFKAQTKMMQFIIEDSNDVGLMLKLSSSEVNTPILNRTEIKGLEHYLMCFRHYDGMTSISVDAGLCGPNLFCENNDQVGSYFLKHHLFVNTYWFSTNVIYQVYKPKRLKDAIKWLIKSPK